MDTPLQRVIREIGRRQPKQIGREATWLAAELGLSRVQAVQNWHTRGIPSRHVPGIAKALDWTMEQVLGDEPASMQWPFEAVPFSRFDALTEREKGAVEQAMLDAIVKVEQNQAGGPSGKRQAGAAR